jgi:hypothetical protein
MNNAINDAAGSGLKPIAIHPRILRPASFPPFDLYVRKDDQCAFALFHKANEPVYANTWEKLRKGGYELCYARGEDRALCLDYVEQDLPAVLADEGLPSGQSAEWVYRLSCRAMEALFAEPESWRDYNRVKQLVDSMVFVIRRHPRIEWQMADCAPRNYSTPAHCVNVSILLVSFAGRVLGVDEPALLAEIGLGGVLHDLGKAMIPAEILGKPAALTRREFAQIKKHPRFGVKMTQPYLRQLSIAPCVIGQHHENSSGNGYPDGRSGEGINTFARAAHIADVFDALTSHRPYGAAVDPYRALNTMVNEMRAQFDLSMLRRFIRHLGTQSEDEAAVVVQADVPAVAQTGAPAAAEETELVAVSAQNGEAQAEATLEAERANEPVTADESAGADLAVATPLAGGYARRAPEAPVVLVPQPAIRLEEIESAAGARAEPQEARAAAALDEPAAPGQADKAQVVIEATVQEKLEAIRDLSEQQAGDTALMGGLLTALKSAFMGPFRRAVQAQPSVKGAAGSTPLTTGGSAQETDSAEVQVMGVRAQAAPQTEVAVVRSIFPLIWQLDEWLDRFGARTPSVPEAVRLRAEAVACLRALRESLIAILSAHNVEIVEDTQRPGAADVSPPQPGAPLRVRRVGFVHHEGAETEILEPGRIVLYADLRKAG